MVSGWEQQGNKKFWTEILDNCSGWLLISIHPEVLNQCNIITGSWSGVTHLVSVNSSALSKCVLVWDQSQLRDPCNLFFQCQNFIIGNSWNRNIKLNLEVGVI